ncbi:MAG TPA: SUF system Fe-S cluster assembly regulator [Terriglobales bacterium]|nr:SUF system Fe-S cluster assembly regulator [Terriglobales bacterium]
MLRISRLTDYGIVLLSFMASEPEQGRSASELAKGTELPLPTVSKLLQLLTREGLLQSQRGAKGGYSLASPPADISLAAIVSALEGPVALTLCTVDPAGDCEYEARCRVRGHLVKINLAIHQALKGITLADVAGAPEPTLAPLLPKEDAAGMSPGAGEIRP